MNVYYDGKDYTVVRPIITIGAFDGVHLGHREILSKLVNTAIEKQGDAVVVTLWPHPRMILDQQEPIKLLNTIEEKIGLLENAGIQHMVVLSFSREFSKLSSREFVENILVNKLNVYHLIVGYNHHFGKNREGNYENISEYSRIFGFTSEQLDAKYVETEKVSSTLIRNAILDGSVDMANKYLGYNYFITGQVITGDKIGRTIGFPTANLKIQSDFKLIPRNGVYAVEINLEGKRLKGMMNIGVRPTVTSIPRLTLEVHIFNFSEDIYGREITVFFKQRIRDEMYFKGLDQLIHQLHADKTEVMKILGS